MIKASVDQAGLHVLHEEPGNDLDDESSRHEHRGATGEIRDLAGMT